MTRCLTELFSERVNPKLGRVMQILGLRLKPNKLPGSSFVTGENLFLEIPERSSRLLDA
jgi:hypothetical protein